MPTHPVSPVPFCSICGRQFSAQEARAGFVTCEHHPYELQAEAMADSEDRIRERGQRIAMGALRLGDL